MLHRSSAGAFWAACPHSAILQSKPLLSSIFSSHVVGSFIHTDNLGSKNQSDSSQDKVKRATPRRTSAVSRLGSRTHRPSRTYLSDCSGTFETRPMLTECLRVGIFL